MEREAITASKVVEVKEGSKKEVRHRQRRLIKQVTSQMEFYFSSANLSKDHFMSELLIKNPYMDLEIFFKFNKLRSMTEDISILRKAVRNSSMLELSEDGMQVKRTSEIMLKEDELECTIYVENIPSHGDHEWVRQVFAQYGTIDYVSLPRYTRSGRPKGFAFVEFRTSKMALSALEAFGALESNIVATTDPSQLQSIKTYNDGGDETLENASCRERLVETVEDGEVRAAVSEEVAEGESRTRIVCTASDIPEELGETQDRLEPAANESVHPKKRKMDSCIEDEENCHKQEEAAEVPSGGTAAKNQKTEASSVSTKPSSTGKFNTCSRVEDAPAQSGKRHKKKRKRNKRVKGEEVESMSLRVMSKKDWKTLRNRYLNMQKENMTLLKKQLQERKHAQQHFYSSKPYFQEGPSLHWDHEQTNHNSEKMPSSECDNLQNTVDDTTSKKQTPNFQFIPNVIIKISFEEPPQDPKKLRETILEGGGMQVAYVDINPTEKDVFIRFKSEEGAAAYRTTGCWSRMEILSGAEETEYWKHITASWLQRRGQRNGHKTKDSLPYVNQGRGREKLLQKAFREAQHSKPSSHIIFKDE